MKVRPRKEARKRVVSVPVCPRCRISTPRRYVMTAFVGGEKRSKFECMRCRSGFWVKE